MLRKIWQGTRFEIPGYYRADPPLSGVSILLPRRSTGSEHYLDRGKLAGCSTALYETRASC